MASADIEVVAEKPKISVVRKTLLVRMNGSVPVFQDGHIVLFDEDGREYLLKAKQQ